MTVVRFKLHPGASEEFKERLLECFQEPEALSAFWQFNVLVVKSDRKPQEILDDVFDDVFDMEDFVRIEFQNRRNLLDN